MIWLHLLLRQRVIIAFVIAGVYTLAVMTNLNPDPPKRGAVKSYNPYARGNAQGVTLKSGKAPGKWGSDAGEKPVRDRYGRKAPEESDWGGE